MVVTGDAAVDAGQLATTPKWVPAERRLDRLRGATNAQGVLPVVHSCASWLAAFAVGRFAMPAQFTFAGATYPRLHHPYNRTWLNERAVEIPIFQALVGGHAPETVLEIGNVLGHYGPREHLVVDRYEQAVGVLNEDIVDFNSTRRFERVVAISTLEHVGLDEYPREPDKPKRAIEQLRGLLTSDGELTFSIPVGHNPSLDEGLRDGTIAVDECRALRRVDGRWQEVRTADAWDAQYDYLLSRANAIVIATVRATGELAPA